MWWLSQGYGVSGPFSDEQMERRVRLNMVKSLDRVSEDQKTWWYLKDTRLWNLQTTVTRVPIRPRVVAPTTSTARPRSTYPEASAFAPGPAPSAPARSARPANLENEFRKPVWMETYAALLEGGRS